MQLHCLVVEVTSATCFGLVVFSMTAKASKTQICSAQSPPDSPQTSASAPRKSWLVYTSVYK